MAKRDSRSKGKKQSVGVVGLGIMGRGIAKNLLAQGYPVTVWNRTKEACMPFVSLGAQCGQTPKETAARSDLVIEIVADDHASRGVWLGEEGILAGASPATILIVSSTLSIPWVDELAEICRARGLRFLDIPVTGSKTGAEGGTLQLLAGGDRNALEEVRTVLGAVSRKIYYF
ncbi:NAD(P)-dependent oxidoreductase, partial [Candidatus Woesearchaeota archaeon CG_4_10_14_0_8_um_filter_47_5]